MIIKIINSLEEPEDHWDWEDCEVEGAIEEQANLKIKIIIQKSLYIEGGLHSINKFVFWSILPVDAISLPPKDGKEYSLLFCAFNSPKRVG